MIDSVTTRYVEALFNVARSRGALDDVQRDVERLAQGLANPAVAARLFDARLPLAARRAEAERLIGGGHELSGNFVRLLFDKRRAGVLRELGRAFRRRWLREHNAAEGLVESARALEPGEVRQLAHSMGTRLGKEVQLRNVLRPELLGGVRILVENRMIDASVRGRLEGLRRHLHSVPLFPSPTG
jgi:F-type H+-transporting ATPase subunit delta